MAKKGLSLFILLVTCSAALSNDELDGYTNKILRHMVEEKYCREVKEFTLKDFSELKPVLPGVDSAFIIVKTGDGRLAYILAQFAKQKTGKESALPMLLIDQFVTYREGEEQARIASGKNLALFNNFSFSLDIGQIVPPEANSDLKYQFGPGGPKLVACGKSTLYLVEKPYPLKGGAIPKFSFNPNAPFDIKHFNGKFKMFDDGRRSGILNLEVSNTGDVKGDFVSSKDGRKYEVAGKTGIPTHSIQFTIKYPQTEQLFSGFLFTGDGKVLAGSSKMESREAGFYAQRQDN